MDDDNKKTDEVGRFKYLGLLFFSLCSMYCLKVPSYTYISIFRFLLFCEAKNSKQK